MTIDWGATAAWIVFGTSVIGSIASTIYTARTNRKITEMTHEHLDRLDKRHKEFELTLLEVNYQNTVSISSLDVKAQRIADFASLASQVRIGGITPASYFSARALCYDDRYAARFKNIDSLISEGSLDDFHAELSELCSLLQK